jgi:hypothetical protein
VLIDNPDILTLLEITIICLDVESAAELWLSLNLKHEHWDGVAKALNTLLPA